MTVRPAANHQGNATAATRPESPLGIYIHFPWCLSKCAYCDFTSVPASCTDIPHTIYAEQVIAELGARLRTLSPRRLTSVYFGGGTPSLWDPAQIHRILEAIWESWETTPQHVELTLECNPSSFTRSAGEALRAAGINRISLGIQSLRDPVLRALGRRHSGKEALTALELALSTGFENTGADLLFAVPGNTLRAEVRDAQTLASTGITHLSAYALTIEPDTELGRRVACGSFEPASGPRVARTFQALHESLNTLGFQHYEISNYARPGYRSVHNQGYWRGHDYLGLGVGATGTITYANRSLRYRNPTSIAGYLSLDFLDPRLLRDEPNAALHGIELEPLTPEVRLAERVMLTLRTTDGLDLYGVAKELGMDAPTSSQRATVERLLANGRLVELAGHLSIPSSLWHLSDGIIRQLL